MMIRNILSRYKPEYIRSLVYMLQASEYNRTDYLGWLRRTSNFSKLERRKKLHPSSKALLLLTFEWLFLLVLIGFSFALILSGPANVFLGFATLALSPFILPYILLVPLFIGEVTLQRSQKSMKIKLSKEKLASIDAIKIGIAGSYGKTTFKEILKTILSEEKKVAATIGNENTPLGICAFIKTLQGNEEIIIFEMGEYYPGEIKELCEIIKPDIGIITGINEAHLSRFKSISQTIKTIYELADYLLIKPLYVNGENELAKANSSPSHILYTHDGCDDWRVKESKTGLNGTNFLLYRGNETISINSRLLGIHQVGPLTAAAVLALHLGVSVQGVEAGIAKIKPVKHRLEPKVDINGIVTIDDSYNGNPDGVKAALEFLGQIRDKRRIYITPGLVELGPGSDEIHIKIGEKLSRVVEVAVLIKTSATPFIEQGLRQANFSGDIIWFNDAMVCYESLPSITVEGDVVLIQNDWPDNYA